MKLALASVLAFFLYVQYPPIESDSVLGSWEHSSGAGHIQIFKRGDKYFGKVIWLKEPLKDGKPRLDWHNPDTQLQNRPILGLEILRDFKYDRDGLWDDGTIYDPKSGKTYRCKMMMDSSDKLEIRGYKGVSLLGKTEVWIRVD
ncbi:DUF2147 domain-containing protein [Hufsiella ginkgonis]|uniref:DUF2147 domain-containing protein n=1 Tax=Hufsiella ginkgonis TaxID=2695274 RepID=A0A7K1Y0I7_9SPHI|nr:DUF2147 domain-containing protein [Hufsiella ginkgonis]MXV16236.1 DUF2147 domain-containing protein [Hufsiella ginkgonis]